MLKQLKNAALAIAIAPHLASAAIAQQTTSNTSDDIGDTATRWTGYFTSFTELAIAAAGFIGLLMVGGGIYMIARKDNGPGNQGGRGWGWVMLVAGGAMFSIVTIRAIMSNSTTG